jgi:hypothetical protein
MILKPNKMIARGRISQINHRPAEDLTEYFLE